MRRANPFRKVLRRLMRAVRARLGLLPKNQLYDHLTAEVIRKVLRRGSCSIDVGCHKGDILKLMLKAAPAGYCYAFEPLPDFCAGLRQKFTRPGIEIHEIALSDADGEAEFNHVVSNPGYSGFRKRRYDRPTETDTRIRVRMRRLDDIVDPQRKVDFIKIDVEGAELQVLRGATAMLQRDHPVVVFEHGLGAADCYGTRPEDVHALLVGQCGMQIWTMDAWLRGAAPLSQAAFCEQFDQRLNYYFLAGPPGPRA